MQDKEQTDRNEKEREGLKRSARIGEGLADIVNKKRIRADWEKW